MSLTELQAPYRRGCILTVLAQSNEAGCGEPLLRTLIRSLGYVCDQDTLAIDLAWVARHGLVAQRDVAGVNMLRITDRGRDVVSRDLALPGVAFARD